MKKQQLILLLTAKSVLDHLDHVKRLLTKKAIAVVSFGRGITVWTLTTARKAIARTRNKIIIKRDICA
jgi:hypothetical protein